MSFYTGIGFSNNPDVLSAAQEAAEQAKSKLQQERIDVAIIFSTPQYDPQEFLPILYQSLNQTRLIGCLTPEIILPDRIESAGLAVLLLTSGRIKFEAGLISHLTMQDLHNAGKTFAENCISGPGQSYRKLLFCLIDGLLDSTNKFIDGMREGSGKTLPIIGAGTNDATRFEKSYQYYQDQILTSSACGLLLGEKFHVGISCQHGWKPLGKPRKVTAVKDNIIQTIDNQKASNIYTELFVGLTQPQDPSRLDSIHLRYPLGFRSPHDQGFIIRNVVATLDDGSIVCQDNVSVGSELHIMLGNKHSCLQAAEQTAYQAREQLAGAPSRLIIVIQSLMRRTLLGRAASQEIQIIRNILGENVPLLGICSQKEIFTSTSQEKVSHTEIHNSSLVILTIG